MAEYDANSGTPLSSVPPKKRKLKHPRTSKACSFCRKRKTRCSGRQPCDLCVREEVTCEYTLEGPLRGSSTSNRARSPAAITLEDTTLALQEVLPSEQRSVVGSSVLLDENGSARRRRSSAPSTALTQDQHVGPTSGVSFLYHRWRRGQENDNQNDSSESEKEDDAVNYGPLLVAYGDVTPLDCQRVGERNQPIFKIDHIVEILNRYFEYVSPSHRFLHHPTVKEWASAYVRQDSSLTASKAAVVLLVCAQTLLQPFQFRDEAVASSTICNQSGVTCYVEAKALLEQERGPPSLASVQARVAMCLYLLSTFRLNECRYCFSFAATIATAMGLHRQHSTTRVDCLEAECRKRTFWSLYILDSYLSVMLGRPRLLRIDDIDQPLPVNVDDHDLLSCEKLDHVPRHGNLEALIAQAKLAQITALNDSQLYPLHPLSDRELLQRSSRMLGKLQQWHEELPIFLQPREKTSIGQRTFERQNTILKLAAAHARIMMTRRCLLIDLTDKAGDEAGLPSLGSSAQQCVRECVKGIATALDTVEVLIDGTQCHSSHWSTQYIAVVALSTLYVLVLQGVHLALPEAIASTVNVNDLLAKSKKCQDFLAALAPSGSQAKRHHLLLAKLRSKVDKNANRRDRRLSRSEPSLDGGAGDGSAQAANSDQAIALGGAHQHRHIFPPSTTADSGVLQEDESAYLVAEQNLTNDLTTFSSIFTPNSNADNGFGYMLEYGWEGLDTVGVSTAAYDLGGFDMASYSRE